MTSRDRASGALGGLAVGDAVNTTLEFKRHGLVTPIDDMVGGGPFDLASGQWTDPQRGDSISASATSNVAECGFKDRSMPRCGSPIVFTPSTIRSPCHPADERVRQQRQR